MCDRFSMLLWQFDDGGTCCGYYLVDDVSCLGTFTECYPWEHVANSYWRTDTDGEVMGYYVVDEVSVLGEFKSFGSSIKKTDCSTYNGAHRCEKKRWRKKGCCCIGWGRNEVKIPGSCSR